ncbi:MAG: hypothetical protein ABJE79_12570 [Marinomonas sp.]
MALKKLNHNKKQQFTKLLAEGSRYFSMGEFEHALSVYKKIYLLTNDPRSLQIQGVCLYKMGLLDESIFVSEKAHAEFKKLGKRDVATLENLAEVTGIKGDLEKNLAYGRACLHLKDEQAMKAAELPLLETKNNNVSTSKRIFSFSLYGSSPRYCENAILNIQAAKVLFPSFVCRFYLDDTVPEHVQNRLREANAEVVKVEEPFNMLPGTMWRFLALDDSQVEIVICRDADSVISVREKDIVEEWLESGYFAHIIRDFPSHCELILAGLVGLRNGLVSNVGKAMLRFLEKGAVSRYTDQKFLREFLWPQVKHNALTHDRCFQYGEQLGRKELAPPVTMAGHIGSNLGAHSMTIKIEAPDLTQIQFFFVMKGGLKIGPYLSSVKKNKWKLSIPDAYVDLLNANQLKIEWAQAD